MFRNNKNLKLQCAVPHIFIEGSKMGHYCSTIDNNDLIYNLFLDLEQIQQDKFAIPHPNGDLIMNALPIFDTSKPEGQFRKPSDNSVIRSMFPDFEFTLMEDGLRESIGWFVENYPNIRL